MWITFNKLRNVTLVIDYTEDINTNSDDILVQSPQLQRGMIGLGTNNFTEVIFSNIKIALYGENAVKGLKNERDKRH